MIYCELEKKPDNVELEDKKKNLLNQVVEIHADYLAIDEDMNTEIDHYIKKSKHKLFDCLKT